MGCLALFAVLLLLLAAAPGLIIQSASTRAAFLAAGGSGLAGAAFGAFRLTVRRSREQSR